MRHRGVRRDGAGEHVVHASTWKEADAILGQAMGTGTATFIYQLSELVDMVEHVHVGEASSGRLGGSRGLDCRTLGCAFGAGRVETPTHHLRANRQHSAAATAVGGEGRRNSDILRQKPGFGNLSVNLYPGWLAPDAVGEQAQAGELPCRFCTGDGGRGETVAAE